MATYTVMSGDGKETLGSFSSMAEAESFLSGEGYSSFSVDDRREGGGFTSGVSIGGGEAALNDIRSGGTSGGIKSIRTNYSGMPFSSAFSSARSALGPGQTFEWNGKQYSTATAEERPDLAAPKPQVLEPAPSVVQPEIPSEFSVPPELPGGYLGEFAGMDAPITNRVAPAAPSIPGAYSPPPADTSTASTPTMTPSGPSIAYGLSDDEIRNRLSTSNYSSPSVDELVGRTDPRNEFGVVAPASSPSQALGQITAAAGQELSNYLAGLAGAQSAVPRAESFVPSDSEYLRAAYGREGFPSYGSPALSAADLLGGDQALYDASFQPARAPEITTIPVGPSYYGYGTKSPDYYDPLFGYHYDVTEAESHKLPYEMSDTEFGALPVKDVLSGDPRRMGRVMPPAPRSLPYNDSPVYDDYYDEAVDRYNQKSDEFAEDPYGSLDIDNYTQTFRDTRSLFPKEGAGELMPPAPSPGLYDTGTTPMGGPGTSGLGDYATYRKAYEEVKGLSDYMARAREEFADHDLVKQQEMGQYMFDQAAPYNTSRREDAARGEYAASMAMAPQKAPTKRQFSLGDVVNLGTPSASGPMTELGFGNLPPLSVDEPPLIGRTSPPLRSSSPIAPRPDYRVDYPVFSADFSSVSSPYLTGLGTLRGTAGRMTRKMLKEVEAEREQSQQETPTISAQGFLTPVVDQYADYASDSMDAAREAMPEILGSRLAPRRSRIRPQRPRWGM